MKQATGNTRGAGVLGILAVASLLGGCTGDTAEQASPQLAAAPAVSPADLVLHGGAIYTVDAARSWAEALAVRDGRLVFVGGNQGVQELVGPKTQVIDLGGRMVLPGMQDVHIHAISGGMDALTCDLNGKQTANEYVATVKQCAEARPDEPWIIGGGWLVSAFGQGATPSRLLLDAVVADRPVYLTSVDGHTVWVNSKALEVSGITRETPDPEGGRIDRNEQGELIGSLQERAGDMVFRHVPPHGLDKRVMALRNAVEMLNRYGITAIQDASFDARSNASELETYAALDASGGLNVRAVVSQRWDRERGNEQIAEFEQRRAQYTRGRLRATTVKIMQDGVLENFTGLLSDPYLVDGSPLGIPMLAPQRLNQAVTELDARGFQVHFHAIGDGAVRQCLDAVAAARAHRGVSGLRHHISHLQLVNPVDVPRLRQLDVIANFQPLWAFADEYVTEVNAPVLGPERMRWMYPIGSVHASGAMIAFGSDWSVSTANPYEQIEVAVRRADPATADGEVFLPDERLPLPAAIAAFTINAAYVNGLERETGSLETGKAADLVVLDRNLFAIDPREISETKALLTLLEGKPVHGDLSAL